MSVAFEEVRHKVSSYTQLNLLGIRVYRAQFRRRNEMMIAYSDTRPFLWIIADAPEKKSALLSQALSRLFIGLYL